MKASDTRGDRILEAIYDDVDARLNPSGDDCAFCGGEGFTYDCIDGCCENADDGCEECARECVECKIFAGQRAKAVREAVIARGDLDVAKAWLKSVDRWHVGITEQQVRSALEAASLAKEREGA